MKGLLIDLDAFEGFAQGSWILSDEGDGYFIIKDAKGNYLIVGDGCLHGKVADLRLAAAAPDLLALAKQQREEIRRLRSALEIAKEFIDDQSDVVDGDYGEPAPNDAMRCLNNIAYELGEIP